MFVKSIPGYEGLYSADRDGNVYSHRAQRQLKPSKTGLNKKYLRITLSPGTRMYVHHAVLLTFTGPRPHNTEARHLNGNSLDNRHSNLAWGTHKANEADKRLHKTLPVNESHGMVKLSNDDCALLRAMRDRLNISFPELGKMFGIGKTQAERICKQKSRRM